MKFLLKNTINGVAITMFALVPVLSYAQIDISLDGNVRTTSDGTSIESVVNSTTSLEANGNVETNANTNTGSKSEANVGSNSKTSTSLKLNSLGVAIISTTQVNSENDLKVYAENVSEQEKSVARVEFKTEPDADNDVEVVYKHRGRLFGFIPVTFKSTTVVDTSSDSEIEVNTRLSWWAFLVSNKNFAHSELESRIQNNTTVRANANANINASPQARAKVAEAVIAEVKAHVTAQASTKASTNN